MRKIMMTLAVLCITVTTLAQTNPATSWGDSAKFTELPPLRADLDVALSARHCYWHLQQANSTGTPSMNSRSCFVTWGKKRHLTFS